LYRQLSSPPWLLAYPFRDSWFVLHDLTNELPREAPHAREFRHGKVTLLEWLSSLTRFHGRPRRGRAGRPLCWRPALIHASMGVFAPTLLIAVRFEDALGEPILSVALGDPSQ
jgi:hypothetical protein